MTSARPLALESTTFEWWHLLVAVLATVGPVVLAAAVLFALYWVIRRAVTRGIQDAEGNTERSGHTLRGGASKPAP
jgi:hypothetical protein